MKNQNERLIDYLKEHGKINPLQAWQELGIYRLSARIACIKAMGSIITTHRVNQPNRFGELCHFAEYVWGGENA